MPVRGKQSQVSVILKFEVRYRSFKLSADGPISPFPRKICSPHHLHLRSLTTTLLQFIIQEQDGRVGCVYGSESDGV